MFTSGGFRSVRFGAFSLARSLAEGRTYSPLCLSQIVCLNVTHTVSGVSRELFTRCERRRREKSIPSRQRIDCNSILRSSDARRTIREVGIDRSDSQVIRSTSSDILAMKMKIPNGGSGNGYYGQETGITAYLDSNSDTEPEMQGISDGDFSEYLWMENEEEFDKQVYFGI